MVCILILSSLDPDSFNPSFRSFYKPSQRAWHDSNPFSLLEASFKPPEVTGKFWQGRKQMSWGARDGRFRIFRSFWLAGMVISSSTPPGFPVLHKISWSARCYEQGVCVLSPSSNFPVLCKTNSGGLVLNQEIKPLILWSWSIVAHQYSSLHNFQHWFLSKPNIIQLKLMDGIYVCTNKYGVPFCTRSEAVQPLL